MTFGRFLPVRGMNWLVMYGIISGGDLRKCR